MVEELRERHRVVLFSSADGLEFLNKVFGNDPEIEVHEIPGIIFLYTDRKIDYVKTVRHGLSFWLSAGREARKLLRLFDEYQPSLAICDFEPLLPRAARLAGVPLVSLDHQHFLSTYDLSCLPPRLQHWAWRMSWATWAFGIDARMKIVSAFYEPPLRDGCDDVVQVSTLLREAVRDQTPSQGDYLLSYVRRATPERVLEALGSLSLPVKIYGLGERDPLGAATFHAIDERTFVTDLAGCDTLISAAGNQLLGEALHFGKPVLALPESGHHEQCINACFLKEMGAGEWRHLEKVTADDMHGFLQRRDTYREAIANSGLTFDGTPKAVEAVERALQELT